jgi:hypothetical protein
MSKEQTIPLEDNANKNKRLSSLALKDALATTSADASDAAATKVLQCFHKQLQYCLETVRKDPEVDFSDLK